MVRFHTERKKEKIKNKTSIGMSFLMPKIIFSQLTFSKKKSKLGREKK